MPGIKILIVVVIFTLLSSSCGDSKPRANNVATDTSRSNSQASQKIFERSKSFLEVLPANYINKVTCYYIKYTKDTVGLGDFCRSELEYGFQGIKALGQWRSGKALDSVFVLPPLFASDAGQSYYFSDTSIPRLNTPFDCCDPDFIFLVGDIDEDGVSEIGQLQFSCNGRSQQLAVWTLKDNQWKKIGECSYDMNYPEPAMSQRVRKIGKGRFQMLDVSVILRAQPNAQGELMKEIKRWKQFRF